MAKAIPQTLLMWIQSNENNEDIVVLTETVSSEPKVGESLWSIGLDRFGTVETVLPNMTYVRVG